MCRVVSRRVVSSRVASRRVVLYDVVLCRVVVLCCAVFYGAVVAMRAACTRTRTITCARIHEWTRWKREMDTMETRGRRPQRNLCALGEMR